MARVLFVAPYKSIEKKAREVIEPAQYRNIDQIFFCRCEKANTAPIEQMAEEKGIDVIVARGQQAALLREKTRLPVVELLPTNADAAQIAIEERKKLGAENPKIAIIGMGNSYFDFQSFNEMYHADLRQYTIHSLEEIPACLQRAADEGVQLIVGGEVACQSAERAGFETRFLESGQEAILNAMVIADYVSSACNLSKGREAEMKALLDYSFNGILKTDGSGVILQVNQEALNFLQSAEARVIGKNLTDLLPEIDRETVENVLKKGEVVYAQILEFSGKIAAVNLTPVQVDGAVEGMIVSLQQLNELHRLEKNIAQAMIRQGYHARFPIESLEFLPSPSMKQLLQEAKQFARSTEPILIQGEHGTERIMLGEAIHRASLRNTQPFVTVDCSCMSEKTACSVLFGSYNAETGREQSGLLDQANGGSLMMTNLSLLPPAAQRRLLYYLGNGVSLPEGDYHPHFRDVRLIFIADETLEHAISRKKFDRDLYYSMDILRLEIPPLRERPEDIQAWTEYFLEELSHKYERHIHLTADAWQVMKNWNWEGNFIQLKSFCRRLVLTARQQMVGENFLKEELARAYPQKRASSDGSQQSEPREAQQIRELLLHFKGDRDAVAAELGISRTTLWRRCRQYGLSK